MGSTGDEAGFRAEPSLSWADALITEPTGQHAKL